MVMPNSNLDRLHQLTTHQILLLESLVQPAPEAEWACQSWLRSVDLDNIDFASYRLIPNLYASHIRGRPLLPNHGRIKGIYRFFHVRNTLLLADARQAVAALHAAGITVVAFKGLAWALKYYERPAQRAMMDADILVPSRDFARADALLRSRGWRYQHSDERRRFAHHSVDLINDGGRAIDLHRRGLFEVRDDAFDQAVIAHSQPFDWDGLPIKMPCPEHLVLIGLVNAMREPANFRLEWICDLARAVAVSPTFDWAAMWTLAQTFGVVEPVFEALCIAADVRGLDTVRAALAELVRPRAEARGSASGSFRFFSGADWLDWIRKFRIATPQDSSSAAGDPRKVISDSPGAETAPIEPDPDLPVAATRAPHLRVFTTPRGDIEALFLRWEHLPIVPRLFDVVDQSGWRKTITGLPRNGIGLLNVPPGVLKRPSGTMPIEAYRATIAFADGEPRAEAAPGERMILPLYVTNRSDHIWISDGAKSSGYGVSWHVCATDGSVVAWDHPRYYFVVPQRKCVAFLEPGITVRCPLEFIAPAEPGEYIIKLDIVREYLSWFPVSGNDFPQWPLVVRAALS